TDDPNRLEVELDKAALSEDFSDNLSNSNYYLRVNTVANQARIKFTIISNKPIPFINDNNIAEDGDNLLLNFLPSITEIRWRNQELEILSNGKISRPEIMLLQQPRRLVLDIPNLMLQNHELEIPENEWIKDVRVSQFKLDPVVLRVVLDLHEDKYLHFKEDRQDNDKIVLETSSNKTHLDDLLFTDNRLEFTSDNPIVPDIFHLEDPDRLVINIMNAVRGDSFLDNINIDSYIVSRIRTSRFNEETIRLVVDMNEMTGYRLDNETLANGRIKHIISFENNFEELLLSDSDSRTNVNLKFSGSIKYETKKLSYPNRFVIDVEGVNLREDYELPDGIGLIKDIRLSQYSKESKITRFVFETEKYEDINVFSMDTNTSINISFLKEVTEKITGEFIVLDPGHGGFDPGAIGPSGLYEKEVVLEIAQLTERLLKNAGYEVIISRNEDEFLSLKERVELANNLNAMVFVSIHANASNSRYSEGIETFIGKNKIADSLPLANLLQEEMINELKRVDRGVKKENFYVIKHTNMPSALVEVSFLSNPHEESLLASNLFKEKAARAISRGILEFIENN
ncbi:MAG: N-acetylmuramoyl-L-alanine amidase, partial [Halanaerobiales bacterium]